MAAEASAVVWRYRRFGACENCSFQDRLRAPAAPFLIGWPPELCHLCQPYFLFPPPTCSCGEKMGYMGPSVRCPRCGRTQQACFRTPDTGPS